MAKKIVLVLLIIFLALFSIFFVFPFDLTNSSDNFYCYQESSNVFNQSGIDNFCYQKYDGSVYYFKLESIYQIQNALDGSYLTGGGGVGYIYINYSSPLYLNSYDNLWSIKSGDRFKNYSLSSCSYPLKLFINITGPGSYFYCYNSNYNYYQQLGYSSSNYIYEEGIYWLSNSSSFIINTSETSSLINPIVNNGNTNSDVFTPIQNKISSTYVKFSDYIKGKQTNSTQLVTRNYEEFKGKPIEKLKYKFNELVSFFGGLFK